MTGITLETAQRMLDVWVAAEESVSHGQSYQIGNRSLTKADLTQIGKRIEYWSNKVTELSQQRAGTGWGILCRVTCKESRRWDSSIPCSRRLPRSGQ